MPASHPSRRSSLLLVLLLGTALACHSTANKNGVDERKTEPFVPLPDAEPDTIGYFLTRFDLSLREWSDLKLKASSVREQNVLAALERSLEKRSKERQGELLEVYESGAAINRRIAAAALGFTHDPSVLSPLLSGLTDPDPELVQKALLGIGVLGLPETPLAEITFHLQRDADSWTRNNAAFALLCIARAGNHSEELADSCRAGLLDPEPGVRAQCASTLGLIAHSESVQALTGLLHDDTNLVALASAASLACIGRAHPDQKGSVARGLSDALDEVPDDRRVSLLKALVWLAEQNLGEDARPWREWAHKLP